MALGTAFFNFLFPRLRIACFYPVPGGKALQILSLKKHAGKKAIKCGRSTVIEMDSRSPPRSLNYVFFLSVYFFLSIFF